MKLNTHLECFAIMKDLLTEKRKCQVLFCQRYFGEKCGVNKITTKKLIHCLLEKGNRFFLISPASCLD